MATGLRYKRARYRVLEGDAAIHIVPERNAAGEGIAKCGYTGKQSNVNHECVTCGPCQLKIITVNVDGARVTVKAYDSWDALKVARTLYPNASVVTNTAT